MTTTRSARPAGAHHRPGDDLTASHTMHCAASHAHPSRQEAHRHE